MIIAIVSALTMGGFALSQSAALRERLGLSEGKPAPVQQPPSPAAAPRKVDSPRVVGANSAPSRFLSPVAPTVTATKSDSLFTDVDGDLQADPGDTIKYTVNISASGGDATGVTLTDTVDPNTAFVGGSLTATPVAVDDTYSALGNVRISVPAPGVLGNDFAGIPAATISAPATSANGGNVAVNPDGSFTYNPPAGFEGTDTFTYTLTNSEGSNPATVTITVSGMIWFINNTASCPCDGRLTNPFNTLASFAAVNNGVGNNPAANDNIFLYESAIDYVGPVALLNGQRFIGQDATASLSSITGLTPPPYSDPLPTTNSGNAIIVNITSASTSITVASGNRLVGFTGGNSTTDIIGTGFGTLTVSDVTLNGLGQALDLTTGTLAAAFISISSTNSATTGLTLTGVGGSLTTGSTTVTSATGIGVSVNTSSASLNFANTSSTLSGSTGVSLLTNTGAITFGSLNITPSANQRGLLATNNSGVITTTGGAITTVGAIAVEITRGVGTTPLAISQTSVSATGGTNGIVLTNTNGSFTVTGSGGTCSTAVTCTGGAILNTTNAVLLSNVTNVSINRMFIQNTVDSGIKGTLVTNFAFTNGRIDNSGTGSGAQTSNIAFNTTVAGTENNLSGTVTITGNSLTNAFFHGVSVKNFNGTLSDVNVSNNTITSNTTTATSKGIGIQFNALGAPGGATTARILKATINLNQISNFPSDAGIQILGGNAVEGGASCTMGSAGNPIAITNNTISGLSAANRIGTQGIIFNVNGTGTGNFNVSGNSVSHTAGNSISHNVFGDAVVTTAIDGNTVVANNSLATSGIAGGTSTTAGFTSTPSLTVTVTNNNVSRADGNGILFVARDNAIGQLNIQVKNNTVAAPLTGVRPGIRVDAGTATGDNDVCLDILGNTSAGSGGSLGIGLRKQGTSTTVNAFGIEGMGATATPAVEAFVNGQNPSGGGTVLLSATSGFSNCGSAPSIAAAAPAENGEFAFIATSESADTSHGPNASESASTYDGPAASESAATSSQDEEDILYATRGMGPGGNDIHTLTQGELSTMVQGAIERWRASGISAEDLVRLQAVTFEVADLPDDQLATATSTSVKVDGTAAEYGWYFDVSPTEDSEFDVAVPNRELQTTEYSTAFGRMDLLTVVMRQLGVAYRQGMESLPEHLQSLMEGTLSPAVRRLPDSRNIQLPQVGGSAANQSGGKDSLVARASKVSASRPKTGVSTSRAFRNTGFKPIAKNASRQSSRLMNHAARSRTTPASMLADVMISIGTLPAGESVTITFNVTVDNPFTGALPQVSNQGTVSGSNFADVLTDDPTVGGTADPTVTPIDLPDVSVAVSPGSVAEDGATNLVYTFTRNGSTANAMTVNFSVGGSANFGASPNDYTETGAATFTSTSGTVTFNPGSATATVTVNPEADTTVETDETVVLTVTSGIGYDVGSPSSASGTITNDDTDVSVAVSPASVAEDGATNLVYTFTRVGVTTTSLTVNFSVAVGGSNAVFPADYAQSGATTFVPPVGTVTFGAGNSTATVTVDPTPDLLVEPDETVIFTVTSGAGYNVGSPASATGTITNDDADVTVTVAPSSATEDGATNLVYTFTRTGFNLLPVTVNFTVGGSAVFSTGDYTQTGAATYSDTSGTVLFGAGVATATVTIDPSADLTVEPDETVVLTVTSGIGYNVGSPASATGTITNDDTDVTVAVSPGSVAEDGATNLVYTFTRNSLSAGALTVNFSVGGSAGFPGDYSQSGAATYSSSAGTVTFGAASFTATVTIDPSADSTVELDETVDITLTSGAGYNVGSPSAASGTITNDDTDVSVAVSPASVAEDGATNLVYTFTRNSLSAGALTVNFSVGGSAGFPGDYSQSGATTYSSSAGTVTFGAASLTATVTVDPAVDTTIETDETVILMVTLGTGYNVSSPSSATGTITTDDADVSVTVAPAAVTEDGATNLVYTFTRTGFIAGSHTVNFSVGGTADFGPSPDDYTQTGATTYTTTSGSVTFIPGSPTATVTVNPETDTTFESDETVIITLTPGASYNPVSPNSATGTILNDDTLVSVVVAPTSTAEGGPNLVYTFSRTGPTASALTVNFSVGGSASFPADYSQSGATTFTPPNATVTFGAGSATATVTVTPLTDCDVEGSETVVFTVQPGAGYGVGSPSTATGTITNTPDSTAPTITLIPNVNMTLWPPNHQYESIAVTDFVASASDNCDPSVNVNSVYILQITSDEVENGNGDGNTLNDIIIGATCKTAQLRAERQGNGDGRVYSITFKVKDSAGNFATATTTVTVRKSPNTPAVDSGTAYVVNSLCP
ncbi:MAG: Calx-beta domain-containing protein [Acidobacteriota bacterium]